MQVLGIAGGTGDERSDLARRLVERLGTHGRVGVVEEGDSEPEPDGSGSEADVTYQLGEDGTWTAFGDGATLTVALGRLAAECDYAIIVGFPDADVAQVVLGETEHRGTSLVEASSVDDVDLDTVVDAFRDVEPYETLESLVAQVKRSPEAEKSGAIATFTGRVRAKDSDEDSPTTHLEFEKYEGVAEKRFATIRRELEARDGVYEVLLHHRTGVIEYGEDIVFVVVLAGHRGEAFATVKDGIDRLKAEVPIFKKETTVDEQFWVHDRS